MVRHVVAIDIGSQQWVHCENHLCKFVDLAIRVRIGLPALEILPESRISEYFGRVYDKSLSLEDFHFGLGRVVKKVGPDTMHWPRYGPQADNHAISRVTTRESRQCRLCCV